MIQAQWRWKDRNVGDWASGWPHYMPGIATSWAHMGSFPEHGKYDAVIVGGGLANRSDKQRHWLEANKNAKNRALTVAWGVGSNWGPLCDDGWNVFLQREWYPDTPHRWAPCPSCMHSLFDCLQNYDAVRPVGFYSNALSSPMTGAYPLMGNNVIDIEEVLTYLAGCELVVTSSYHGMYWASLLGKPVVAVTYRPKMRNTLWTPGYVGKWEDWRDAEKDAKVFPDLLAQCRGRTEEVMNVIRGAVV
jgi:hypothetical protein